MTNRCDVGNIANAQIPNTVKGILLGMLIILFKLKYYTAHIQRRFEFHGVELEMGKEVRKTRIYRLT